MENLLLEAITHVKNISKKNPTVKQLLVRINSPGANNWDESIVEEILCILRTKGIINENYKILTTNDTNTSPCDDELLEWWWSALVSSADDTPPGPNLKNQFFISNSTVPTILSAVISGTPTSPSKENSIHNKHDPKDERIEHLNTQLKVLKFFI